LRLAAWPFEELDKLACDCERRLASKILFDEGQA
jgi:hypothetical protein